MPGQENPSETDAFSGTRHNLPVPSLQRPLSLVTVSDRAMEPELHPEQLVYVQNFEVHGLNYLEQRVAVRVERTPGSDSPKSDSPKSESSGRVLVRRIQAMAGGTIPLFGNQDGSERRFTPPVDWKLFGRWKLSGRLHPRLVALGPLVTARAGGRTYIATAGWAN